MLRKSVALLVFLGFAVRTAIPHPSPSQPKTLTVAFAANDRYFVPLMAILERIRSMPQGLQYRLILYDLGLIPAHASTLRCLVPDLLDEVRLVIHPYARRLYRDTTQTHARHVTSL